MTFRALTAADVPDLASLIAASGQSHVFLYGAQELLEMLNPDHPYQCFVWDEEGIQGAYFMNWKPEFVSIPKAEERIQGTYIMNWKPERVSIAETANFCFLDRMFWSSTHPFEFAHKFFLFSAQFEATLRGFDDLILPTILAIGGRQPYLDLGGEVVQFYAPNGTPLRSQGIRFHLLKAGGMCF